MKKYLVIGNPIDHSLSPELHNYWIKKNNIDAVYYKKKLDLEDIKKIVDDIRNNKINGVNVTTPFKKDIISFVDDLSEEALITQSVNTILLENNKIKGFNTDIIGFQLSLKEIKFDLKNKKVLILGSGGVVPSIIFSLQKSGISEITLSNRTKNKADELKNTFPNLKVVEWGKIPEFDIVIGFFDNCVGIVRLSGAFCVDSAIFHPKITLGVDLGAKTNLLKNLKTTCLRSA